MECNKIKVQLEDCHGQLLAVHGSSGSIVAQKESDAAYWKVNQIAAKPRKQFQVQIEVPSSFDYGDADGLLIIITYTDGDSRGEDCVQSSRWIAKALAQKRKKVQIEDFSIFNHSKPVVSKAASRYDRLLMPRPGTCRKPILWHQRSERLGAFPGSIAVRISVASWARGGLVASDTPRREEPPELMRSVLQSNSATQVFPVRLCWFYRKKSFTFHFINTKRGNTPAIDLSKSHKYDVLEALSQATSSNRDQALVQKGKSRHAAPQAEERQQRKVKTSTRTSKSAKLQSRRQSYTKDHDEETDEDWYEEDYVANSSEDDDSDDYEDVSEDEDDLTSALQDHTRAPKRKWKDLIPSTQEPLSKKRRISMQTAQCAVGERQRLPHDDQDDEEMLPVKAEAETNPRFEETHTRPTPATASRPGIQKEASAVTLSIKPEERSLDLERRRIQQEMEDIEMEERKLALEAWKRALKRRMDDLGM